MGVLFGKNFEPYTYMEAIGAFLFYVKVDGRKFLTVEEHESWSLFFTGRIFFYIWKLLMTSQSARCKVTCCSGTPSTPFSLTTYFFPVPFSQIILNLIVRLECSRIFSTPTLSDDVTGRAASTSFFVIPHNVFHVFSLPCLILKFVPPTKAHILPPPHHEIWTRRTVI